MATYSQKRNLFIQYEYSLSGRGGVGRGSTNVNQELKVLLKEHKGILQLITVKNMKTGAHNPLGLLKMRGN